MLLPDVNVWLALVFDFHFHHRAAKTWYEASSESCFFCRWTQQGFLRLATNATVFQQEAIRAGARKSSGERTTSAVQRVASDSTY